ncbi:phasin family protein [Franzmannia qiaohouensis]|uniref:Phasin family protein n=1 Tax=Franzmannia qiaohouensis TaxID=1329370 RepID=A0ABU1HG62_9GAMM|nr:MULTISPECIES: phasin family protein [Halomonas]APX94097.1 phasin family protein [Halomonas sp. 1513]MDR5906460.1 phasin family protein [Halomonas qiaohouensis]
MSNATIDQATQQFESMFFGPARAYAALSLDYAEKLLNTQYEAVKAYSDVSMSQARAMLDIKDAEGLRTYVEGQQKVAKELSERVKGDAEKVVALNQDFVQQGQKLAEENIQTASKAASKAAK